jgi:hypothetical protein
MKNKTLQAIIVEVLLVGVIYVLALPLQVVAVSSPVLSPSSGIVGSNITVTAGTTNLGQPYSIWFDINANGNPLEAGEMIKTGSSSGYTITSSFLVPDCIGNNTGLPHLMALREYDNGSYAMGNFSVLTSRAVTAPSYLRAGNNVTLTIVIKGGGASELRTYGVRVTRPDNSTSGWYNFTQSTHTLGSLSRTITYPSDFSSPTTVTGNYFVQVYETTPAPSTSFAASFVVSNNTAPTATITSITPNPAQVGQQVSFAGAGSDINGSIIAYRWTSNVTGQLSTSPTFSSSLPAGIHLISLQVQDADGLWSTTPATGVVSVTQPSNLIAVIDALAVDSSVSPTRVTFTGHGVDSIWPITGYQWETSVYGAITTIGTDSTFTTATLPVGIYTISFRVQNSQGTWSNAATQQLIVPQGGGSLAAMIDSVSPNPAVVGQKITFSGHGIITNGIITNYQWTSNLDGILSSAASFSTSTLSPGTHLISFMVQNATQNWSPPATVTLSVTSSDIPPVASVDRSVTPAKAQGGNMVSFSGSGTDTDGTVVAYSWDSDIDGHLSDSSSFSISTLSRGIHTISFSVRDNAGVWSNPVTLQLEIGNNLLPVDPTISVVTVTAVIAGSAIVCTTYYFQSLPTSARFNQEFRKKYKKEKTRQEEEKKKQRKKRREGKPDLELEASAPVAVFGPLQNAAQLTVKNTGSVEAKAVALMSSTDTGVTLVETLPKPFALASGESKTLSQPFDLSDQTRRGIYRLFFRAGCAQDISPDVICLFRNFKIGLLSSPATAAYVDPLRVWMQKKNYSYTDLQNADDLRGTLHQYDLIVLAPELELTDKWIRNLSSYVKNSQSLLVIDKVMPGQNPKSAQSMAELLGYETLKFESFQYGAGQLKFSDDPLVADFGFVPSDEAKLQSLTGNHCISTPTKAKRLTEYICQNNATNLTEFPVLVANKFGKGRVLHLNFHAEQAIVQLDSILEKAFNWLLCTDALSDHPET